MGRPKSTKPVKSKILSIRLTETDYMKIKKIHGSIQAFLDLMIKTLPIIILMSCNGQEATSPANTNDNFTQEEVYTNDFYIYATVPYHMRQGALGYKIHVRCNDNHCMAGGDLHSYKAGNLIKSSFPNTRFELAGSHAIAEICLTAGDCYDAVLYNKGQWFQISNQNYCIKGTNPENPNNYNAFPLSGLPIETFDFITTPASACAI